jgi:protein-L-isoaspartate(D-aspartate) O-methyltransferase
MVEQHLKRRGIHDERVIEAMFRIPREEFLPESGRRWSYCDEPASIGHGQTISQPYITALMTQTLELKGNEKVLEVGTGCGYHAAVIAELAAEVVSVEIVPELAEQARKNLERTGYAGKVLVVCGDGSMGYPPRMPYDAISVAAAAPEAPSPLLEQLNDWGRMVIPIGSLLEQDLVVITKSEGKIMRRVAAQCRFVPLKGGQGWVLE